MTEKEPLIDGREGQTDLANARRFVRQHGQDVRYVSQTRKWLVWDSRRWKPVKPERAEQLAKETADAIWRELQSATGANAQSLATHAKRSASAAGIVDG